MWSSVGTWSIGPFDFKLFSLLPMLWGLQAALGPLNVPNVPTPGSIFRAKPEWAGGRRGGAGGAGSFSSTRLGRSSRRGATTRPGARGSLQVTNLDPGFIETFPPLAHEARELPLFSSPFLARPKPDAFRPIWRHMGRVTLDGGHAHVLRGRMLVGQEAQAMPSRVRAAAGGVTSGQAWSFWKRVSGCPLLQRPPWGARSPPAAAQGSLGRRGEPGFCALPSGCEGLTHPSPGSPRRRCPHALSSETYSEAPDPFLLSCDSLCETPKEAEDHSRCFIKAATVSPG
ncbi:hypothetical protein H8959_003935 [Pygathrix nigripes]